jgi:iron complex outermembrane receptor protein
MIKTRLLCACAASVIAMAAAAPAHAQLAAGAAADAQDTQDNSRDIVITGSIIRGTP